MDLGKVGEAVLGAGIGSVFGKDAAKYGSELDVKSKLGHESALWERAQFRGLTPQEYYGSSAPGGASGSAGAGQVLGNSQQAMAQQMTMAGLQSREKEKDRQNAKEIAEIQAGTQRYGTDKQFEANMARLNLDTQQFMQVTIPQAAANLNKTNQEVERLINEVATSKPKFIRMMKFLSMGPDNVYVTAALNAAGVDVTDVEQMQALPTDELKKILAAMLTGKSNLAKEISALSGQGDSLWSSLQKIYEGGKSLLSPGIEPADNKPRLGNKIPGGSRFGK